MVALNPPVCDFGWPAPDFDLPGTDGKRHTRDACRGPNGLLVVFICNHCPYVQAVIDRLVRDAGELQALGIGVVAISSNDATAYPADAFPEMARFAEQHAFPFPYLYDETQAVARAYGAVCTPDFFGFNAALALQYRGRLDDTGRGPARPDARRELFDAMRQVAASGCGPQAQTPSIGCSLKWKDGN
ncbi:MAG: thioredoxin family protein [Rhodocyclales bacterium]|nr:thioredoxin family protein [Rhodocyclales bacterium]